MGNQKNNWHRILFLPIFELP